MTPFRNNPTRALVGLVCLAVTLPAAPLPKTILSKSRQHTISTTVLKPRPIPLGSQKPIPDRLQLAQHTLAHFAQTMKDQVLTKLQLPLHEKWTGRIHLNIFPGRMGDKLVFEKKRYLDRWHYRLDLPEIISGMELARVLVAVHLEEYAARNSRTAPPLPAWLAEGLTEHILGRSGPVLFVPFQTSAGGRLNFQFPNDPLQHTRRVIQGSAPVSFLNLTLPPPGMKTDAGRKILRAHSHLLVAKLLAKANGAGPMKRFLRELPRHKNSQRAFLIAFGHRSMLHAEQWWMLAQTQFRSRDQFNRWIPGLAMGHLADALKVRPPGPGPPTVVSMQQFLRTSTRKEHQKILDPLLQQLLVIQVNAPPKVAKLARDYRQVIGQHLGHEVDNLLRPRPTAKVALLEVTLEKLNKLDIILTDLQALRKAEVQRAKITDPPPTP